MAPKGLSASLPDMKLVHVNGTVCYPMIAAADQLPIGRSFIARRSALEKLTAALSSALFNFPWGDHSLQGALH